MIILKQIKDFFYVDFKAIGNRISKIHFHTYSKSEFKSIRKEGGGMFGFKSCYWYEEYYESYCTICGKRKITNFYQTESNWYGD